MNEHEDTSAYVEGKQMFRTMVEPNEARERLEWEGAGEAGVTPDEERARRELAEWRAAEWARRKRRFAPAWRWLSDGWGKLSAVSCTAGVMLMLALCDMPGWYYAWMKVAVFLFGVLAAVVFFRRGAEWRAVLAGLIAALFNPWVSVKLHGDELRLTDLVCVGVVLLFLQLPRGEGASAGAVSAPGAEPELPERPGKYAAAVLESRRAARGVVFAHAAYIAVATVAMAGLYAALYCWWDKPPVVSLLFGLPLLFVSVFVIPALMLYKTGLAVDAIRKREGMSEVDGLREAKGVGARWAIFFFAAAVGLNVLIMVWASSFLGVG